MALNNLGMGIVFSANDLVSGVIGGMMRNFFNMDNAITGIAHRIALSMRTTNLGFQVLNQGLKQIAKNLAVVAVAATSLKIAFGLAKAAGEFDQLLIAVQTKTRATVDELEKLRETALNVALRTEFSPEQAGQAMNAIASAGKNAAESMEILGPTLDLATASMGKLTSESAAQAITGTLNAFTLGAEKATEVSDKLVRVSQLTNFQLKELGVGLSRAASVGKLFGESLNDVLIGIGALRDQNVEASVASTALRESMTRLATDQTVKNKLKNFLNIDLAGKKILDVFEEVSQATKDLAQDEKNDLLASIFGKRGILAFAAVANAQKTIMVDGRKQVLRGAKAIAFLRKEMATAGGTAREFADRINNSFKGLLKRFEGTKQALMVSIGTPFKSVFIPIMKVLVAITESLVRVLESIPRPVKQFFAALIVVGSIVAGFISMKAAIIVVMGILAHFSITFGTLMAFVSVKLILVVGAIIAAFLLLKHAWQSNFVGIRDLMLPIFEKMSLVIRSIFGFLTKGEVTGKLAKDLLKVKNGALFEFVRGFVRGFQLLKASARGFVRSFALGFKVLGTKTAFRAMFQAISKAVKEVFKSILILGNAIAKVFGLDTPSAEFTENLTDMSTIFNAIVQGPLMVAITGFAHLLGIMALIVESLAWTFGWLVKISSFLANSSPQLQALGAIVGFANKKLAATGPNSLGPASDSEIQDAAKRKAQRIQNSKSVSGVGAGIGAEALRAPPSKPVSSDGKTTTSQDNVLEQMWLWFQAQVNDPGEIKGTLELEGEPIGRFNAKSRDAEDAKQGKPKLTNTR